LKKLNGIETVEGKNGVSAMQATCCTKMSHWVAYPGDLQGAKHNTFKHNNVFVAGKNA
jgi:hypothetical protein